MENFKYLRAPVKASLSEDGLQVSKIYRQMQIGGNLSSVKARPLVIFIFSRALYIHLNIGTVMSFGWSIFSSKCNVKQMFIKVNIK